CRKPGIRPPPVKRHPQTGATSAPGLRESAFGGAGAPAVSSHPTHHGHSDGKAGGISRRERSFSASLSAKRYAPAPGKRRLRCEGQEKGRKTRSQASARRACGSVAATGGIEESARNAGTTKDEGTSAAHGGARQPRRMTYPALLALPWDNECRSVRGWGR